ncbi:unnamed protein product [Caenorhabditis auriculariae]|uniref:ETFB lysine methyltransferase n=1 Tax=Caenorhabditis auriculariae TaxID=2777116 RepID=A0A8S1H6Y5_9PELO|nr:unnamed protein product [Caenorhabditis auriculariae]
MSTPEACPMADPYWAFYWPGGQAMTRFILDHRKTFGGKHVIDFGAGCGSASIAASLVGASRVLVNDIDQYALLATLLNFRLNGVSVNNVSFSQENLLEKDLVVKNFFAESDEEKFIILGDMFYDSDFAASLFAFLKRSQKSSGTRVFVGDPDRHPLTEKRSLESYRTKFEKRLVAEYSLPGYVIREHYGFNTAKVFELVF